MKNFRDKVQNKLSDAFTVAAYRQELAFVDTFDQEIFDWPNLTVRSTGEIASSPRDIVDTGKLRDSVTLDVQGLSATYRWSAHDEDGQQYADKVLLGEGDLPGRDWIQATWDRGDTIAKFMQEELK